MKISLSRKLKDGVHIVEKPKPILHNFGPDDQRTNKIVRHILTIVEDGTPYKFFEFAEVYDMPCMRWQKFDEYLEDMSRGLSRDELIDLLTAIQEGWEQNDVKGSNNAYMLLKWGLARLHIINDLDFMLRWLSVALFLEDEGTFEYDWDIGTRKIELIEKNGLGAFFLSSPIKRYFPHVSISSNDMEILKEQRNAKRALFKELVAMGISLSTPSKDKPS